jgi:hypothetical protein
LAACAGGGATLGYIVPASPEVTYVVGDTLTLGLEGLGQEVEIGARSAATYVLRYAAGPNGPTVTATLQSLAADVVTPMTEPMALSEDAIEGSFEFDLDDRGRALSVSSPQATGGGQVFAAPLVAHTLFPRLLGRAASTGDSWVDSVMYSETTEAGETSVVSVLTYTAEGGSQAGGRALTDIAFVGTATVSQALSIEGAAIRQTFEADVSGSLRWDAAAGLLYDSESVMEGRGNVRVALLPAQLPTQVRWVSRVQMRER